MKSVQNTSKSRYPSRGRGFTLIELLVTISISVILMSVAVPSFSSFVLGQRVKATSYDVSSALILARSEAIKRNSDVVISPLTGGWQKGWSVTSGTTTLNTHEPMPGLTIAGPGSNVTFGSNGRLNGAISPTGFSIGASIDSSVTQRCVNVDLSGLPNSKTGAC